MTDPSDIERTRQEAQQRLFDEAREALTRREPRVRNNTTPPSTTTQPLPLQRIRPHRPSLTGTTTPTTPTTPRRPIRKTPRRTPRQVPRRRASQREGSLRTTSAEAPSARDETSSTLPTGGTRPQAGQSRLSAPQTRPTPDSQRRREPVDDNAVPNPGQPRWRYTYAWAPNAQEVFQHRMPTLKHIPKRSRIDVANALSRTIWDCALAEDGERARKAHLHLFMFARCVLRPVPRDFSNRNDGFSRPRSINDTVRDRTAQWTAGEAENMWHLAKSTHSSRTVRPERDRGGSGNQERNNLRRAKLLTREGAYGKAARALSSSGIHTMCEAVKSNLLSKHPISAPDTDGDFRTEQFPVLDCPPIETTEVLEAIKRMPRGSAAGSSGLSPTHLRELISTTDAQEHGGLLHAIAALCTRWARGRAPPELAVWIAGAPVTPLRKRNNDVRPIAVGETIRRIVASVLLRRHAPEIKSYLAPHQVGVMARNGAESVIHAVRALTERHGQRDELALLKVDFTNAFNLIARPAFLQLVAHRFPGMRSWIDYCYGEGLQPNLWVGDFLFRSTTGVQQGDPLGPLLFSLALQPVILELRRKMVEARRASSTFQSPLLLAFYLDDGIIVGNHETLHTALSHLQSDETKKYGLHLKPSDTRIWWPTSVPIAIATNLRNTFNVQVLDPATEPGIDILGAPIGSAQYMEQMVFERSQKTALSLEMLERLGDSHAAFTLARACFGSCRINYALRTTPPTSTKRGARRFDKAMKQFVNTIVGGGLEESAFAELQLPVTITDPTHPHCGAGLTSACSIAPAAYLASYAAASNTAQPLLITDFIADDARLLAPNINFAEVAYNHLTNLVGRNNPQLLTLRELIDRGFNTSQRDLTRLIHDTQATRLRTDCERTRIHRLAQNVPGAKDWLKAPPSPGIQTHIRDTAFRMWFGFYARALKSFGSQCIRHTCTSPLDLYGDHLLICNKGTASSGSPRNRRHDRAVRLLSQLLRQAHRAPIIEPRNWSEIMTANDSNDTRTDDTEAEPIRRTTTSRPDIRALGMSGGEDLIDVTFTHCLTEHAVRTLTPRRLLELRYGQKLRQHEDLGRRMTGGRIIPIVFAVTGGWHPESRAYVQRLVSAVSVTGGIIQADDARHTMYRFAALNVESNARCLTAGLAARNPSPANQRTRPIPMCTVPSTTH